MVHGKGLRLNLPPQCAKGTARPAATESGIARRLTQIDADTEKKTSSSASICVICGQMPFSPNVLWCNSLETSQRENLVGIA